MQSAFVQIISLKQKDQNNSKQTKQEKKVVESVVAIVETELPVVPFI